MKKKQIIIGFDKEHFAIENINKMSDRQKHECYLENTDTTCAYDSVQDFFGDLNDSVLAKDMTRNYYWSVAEID